MLKVSYTNFAIQDLEDIKRYIYNDNYIAAKKVISHIVLSISNLKYTPNIGRLTNVLRTRELIISKYPYIVPYSVLNDKIVIYRILHTSKKFEQQ